MGLSLWGWRARPGGNQADEQGTDSETDTDRNIAPATMTARERNFETTKAPLLKLADRLAQVAAGSAQLTVEGLGAIHETAQKRRDRLRRAFVDLGIETTCVVAAARVRPSCTFLSRQRQRRLSGIGMEKPQRRCPPE